MFNPPPRFSNILPNPLTTGEAARELGCSDSTLQSLVNSGQLNAARLPSGGGHLGFRRIERNELDKLRASLDMEDLKVIVFTHSDDFFASARIRLQRGGNVNIMRANSSVELGMMIADSGNTVFVDEETVTYPEKKALRHFIHDTELGPTEITGYEPNGKRVHYLDFATRKSLANERSAPPLFPSPTLVFTRDDAFFKAVRRDLKAARCPEVIQVGNIVEAGNKLEEAPTLIIDEHSITDSEKTAIDRHVASRGTASFQILRVNSSKDVVRSSNGTS